MSKRRVAISILSHQVGQTSVRLLNESLAARTSISQPQAELSALLVEILCEFAYLP